MTNIDQLFPAGRSKDRPAIMSWHTIASSYVIELAEKAGVDLVMIDMQHGLYGKTELIASLTAARAARLPALVRVTELTNGQIGEALDAGAQGVICPMVDNAADAQKLVQAVKYPPLGTRSYGPYRSKLLVEDDHLKVANGWTIACAQIETAEAIDNIDEILMVEGVDMVLVGPNDLAISLSEGQTRDINGTEVLAALERVLAACRKHKVASALFANDWSYAKPQMGKGWDLMTVGTDASILSAGIAEIASLAKAR